MLVALEVKSCYSILNSLNKIDMLTEKAKELGYFSLALTDLNNMFGVYEFYLSCRKKDIKPIIGMKVEDIHTRYILLAKNNNGYKNLIKLSTIRSERELNNNDLEKYNEDIILIMPYTSYNKDIYNIFKDKYIGYTTLEERKLIKEDNIVFINDVSYLEKDDYKYLDYLYMIKEDKHLGETELNTFKGKNLLDENDFNLLVDSLALANMKKIVEGCNVTLEYTKGLLPIYDVNINAFDYLTNLCNKGLKRRLSGNVTKEYQDRLNYELDIINKMGFSDYFLVVWDYVKYAKFNNILVGPGRGSASGSLVSYSIGITDVDPIKYNLLFERFLNPERVTMPDIDVDFDSEKRSLVTDYVTKKYGDKKVAGIITFNTLGAKQVIRDLGRVFNISLPILDDIAKGIVTKDLKDSYVRDSKFYNIINSKDEYKLLYKIALKLEGLPRHISIHAAGVVMSNLDLDNIIPLYKNQLGMYTTAFSKDYLEPLGLLKMDFLGLDNLTLISNVIEDIRKNEKINISFDKIPMDDKKAIEIFNKVDTDGIFQFESPGIKRFLEKLKPNSFDDISLALALYRPGPMDNIDSFIRRREGREEIDYIHPNLKEVLEPTSGIIVYQEQIMQIVRIMAGYSYGEADILRRAMSKKKEDIILKEKPKFIDGSINLGYSKETAEKVYNMILKFANYGFNKSHSVAYAIIAYKMAFIKAYFLKYFLCGLLSNAISNNFKTNIYLNRARKAGIKILPPDVNESNNIYYVSDNSIRCPLSIISSVGISISNDIIKEREHGKYIDICDFILRTNKKGINKRVLTNLIYAGALNFGYNKRTLIENLDNLLNYAEVADDNSLIETLKPEIEIFDEYNKNDLVNYELKSTSFYLTEHPVSKYREDYSITSMDIDKYFNKNIKLVASIGRIKEVSTKNNDIMAFITGNDEYGDIDLTLFPNTYKIYNNVKEGNIIEAVGKVEKRYDKYQIIVNNIKILE